MSFHGTRPWDIDEGAPFLVFGFMYAEPAAEYGTSEDAFIYCAVNAYWENMAFELPAIPEGMKWEIVAYTGDDRAGGGIPEGNSVNLIARSLMLLIGHKKGTVNRKGGKSSTHAM